MKKGLFPGLKKGDMSSSEVQTGDSSQQINEGNIAVPLECIREALRRQIREIKPRSNTEDFEGSCLGD